MKQLKQFMIIFILTCRLINAETILETQSKALKEYQKNKNLTQVIKLFEDNGIENIVKDKPQELSVAKYTSLLNDYAFYLSETSDRFMDSIPIFEKIIEINPKRTVVYLNIGDVLFKSYNREKREEIKEKITYYYQKYTSLIDENKFDKKIPIRVLQILSEKDKVMKLGLSKIGLINNDGIENDFKNIEKEVSSEEKNEIIREIKKSSKNEYFEEYMISEIENRFRFSKLDVDKDGEDEIKLTANLGTGYYDNTIIIKKQKNGEYAKTCFYGGGYRYGEGEWLEYNGNIYIFEVGEEDEKIGVTISIVEKSEIKRLNNYTQIKGKINNIVVKNKTEIGSIIKNQAIELFSQKTSIDINKSNCMSLDEKEISNLEKYLFEKKIDNENAKIYACDIDNDGVDEIFTKYKKYYGNALFMRIFKKKGQKYKELGVFEDEYKNFEKTGIAANWTGLSNGEIIFKNYKGKNYLIELNNEVSSFSIYICLINNKKLELVDEITANAEIVVEVN